MKRYKTHCKVSTEKLLMLSPGHHLYSCFLLVLGRLQWHLWSFHCSNANTSSKASSNKLNCGVGNGIQQRAGLHGCCRVRQGCCGCKADGHGWVQRAARHSSDGIATACHARADRQAKEHGGTIFLLSIAVVN